MGPVARPSRARLAGRIDQDALTNQPVRRHPTAMNTYAGGEGYRLLDERPPTALTRVGPWL